MVSGAEDGTGRPTAPDGDHDDGTAAARVAPGGPADAPRDVLRTVERERDVAEASRDRFSFLAEVSRCLADSLDYEATLTVVAGMSLPYLDAWCIVDVITEDGGIRRLAVLHPDPARQDVARELHRRYPPEPTDLLGAPRVLRTARPEMVFDVPDEALATAARDEHHLALLRALGLRSYVIVPMIARGRTLGAITFVTADSSRRFGPIDVVMAEDLARRAAMAVDNARLHAEAVDARAAAEAALVESELATEALRDARDVAEEALKVRTNFLATMTHEVRTPLNAVVGYMQLLELELAGELTETQRTYVARARDSARHLLRLVDDVLDIAKDETGQLDVGRDAVSVAETARAAVAVLRPQAGGKLVSLADTCSGARALRYLGDEHRVRQILINLLANAIKFTAVGGRVALECALEERAYPDSRGVERWVLFHVRDSGRGVAAEEAESIFEPFVQGEAGLTRAHGGAGLGLSISRRLARLMGGDVTVEASAASGHDGATFTLRLPAAPATEDRVADASRGSRADEAPVSVSAEHRTQSGRAAVRRGLGAAAEALLRQIGPTVEDFVELARQDPTLTVTDEMTDVEVADHLATLLTDLANSLAVLGEASGEVTDQLMDGSRIQRLIGELHGAHRSRLGWTEAQLMREGELIRDVCEAAISRAVAGDAQAAEAAVTALSRLLQERVRASRHGFRGAGGAGS